MLPLLIGYGARAALPLLLAAALALAGAGVTYKVMAGKVAQAQAERDQLAQTLAALAAQRQKDMAILASRAKKNAAAARADALARQRLQQALRDNPAWADQPLPKELQDALGQP